MKSKECNTVPVERDMFIRKGSHGQPDATVQVLAVRQLQSENGHPAETKIRVKNIETGRETEVSWATFRYRRNYQPLPKEGEREEEQEQLRLPITSTLDVRVTYATHEELLTAIGLVLSRVAERVDGDGLCGRFGSFSYTFKQGE